MIQFRYGYTRIGATWRLPRHEYIHAARSDLDKDFEGDNIIMSMDITVRFSLSATVSGHGCQGAVSLVSKQLEKQSKVIVYHLMQGDSFITASLALDVLSAQIHSCEKSQYMLGCIVIAFCCKVGEV